MLQISMVSGAQSDSAASGGEDPPQFVMRRGPATRVALPPAVSFSEEQQEAEGDDDAADVDTACYTDQDCNGGTFHGFQLASIELTIKISRNALQEWHQNLSRFF